MLLRLCLIFILYSCLSSCVHFKGSRAPSNSGSNSIFSDFTSLSESKDKVNEIFKTERERIEAQSCVEAMCGTSDKNITYNDLIRLQFETDAYDENSKLYTEFDPIIRENLKANRPDINFYLQEVKWIAESGDFKINNGLDRTIKAYYFIFKIYLPLLEIKFSNGEITSLDDEFQITQKDIEDMGFDSETARVAVEGFKIGLFETWKTAYSLVTTPLREIIAFQFNTDFKSGLKVFLFYCNSNREQVLDQWGFPNDYKAMKYCQEVAEIGDSRPFNQERLVEVFANIQLTKEVLSEKFEKLLNSYSLNYQLEAQKLVGSEYYKTLDSYKDIDWSDVEDSMANYCHLIVKSNVATHNGADVIDKANKVFNTLKQSTIRMVDFKDGPLSENFKQKVNSMEIRFPSGITEFKDIFVQTVKEDTAASAVKVELQNAEETRGLSIALSLVTGLGNIDLNEENVPTNLFEDTKNICDSFQVQPLSDHIYTSSGNAYLSWATARYPKFGIGIMAHELGHHVAEVLRSMSQKELSPENIGLKFSLPEKKNIWEKRQCVGTFHDHEKLSRDQEKHYVEEDWADVFAAHLMNYSKIQLPEASNFACSLIEEKDDQYVLYLENNPEDTHSTGFFRAVLVDKILNGGKERTSCPKLFNDKLRCL